MKRIRKVIVLCLLFCIVIFSVSCDNSPTSIKGMVLPKGDVDRGKLAFVTLGCNKCHTVTGIEFPEHEDQWQKTIQLGGEVYRVKNYGELVTSITNPDHVLTDQFQKGQDKDVKMDLSLMPILIEEMTVKELLDLVTFLGKQYKEKHPEYHDELWF